MLKKKIQKYDGEMCGGTFKSIENLDKPYEAGSLTYEV
jgi:hypothetical protein